MTVMTAVPYPGLMYLLPESEAAVCAGISAAEAVFVPPPTEFESAWAVCDGVVTLEEFAFAEADSP